MPNKLNTEQKTKLLQLLEEAVKHDAELRANYQVGDKFRFIRDRLNALLLNVQEQLAELEKKNEEKKDTLAEDEMVVYVYLFNAQGILVQTWQKLLTPAVFYDHSVNRPVYTDKTQIEAFIRSKPNHIQHAYFTIAIPKQVVIKTAGTESLKDALGQPVIKIKEGSLQFNRFMSFTHNGHDYVLNEAGVLTKKLT